MTNCNLGRTVPMENPNEIFRSGVDLTLILILLFMKINVFTKEFEVTIALNF